MLEQFKRALGNISYISIHILGVPEKGERERRIENVFDIIF